MLLHSRQPINNIFVIQDSVRPPFPHDFIAVSFVVAHRRFSTMRRAYFIIAEISAERRLSFQKKTTVAQAYRLERFSFVKPCIEHLC